MTHDSQLFPVRQHFDYGSPPRGTTLGGGGGGGVVIGSGALDGGDVVDKADHYATQMDDKYDNHCGDGCEESTFIYRDFIN